MLKPAQREGDRVDARAQVDDAVLTGAVGHDRSDFSISAGLDASTVTPGSTAPEASLTTPVMTPGEYGGGDERQPEQQQGRLNDRARRARWRDRNASHHTRPVSVGAGDRESWAKPPSWCAAGQRPSSAREADRMFDIAWLPSWQAYSKI